MLENLFGLYIGILEKILRSVGVKFRGVRIGPLEFDLKPRPDKSYAKTLEKIELTKEHLSEAILAVDNLKNEIVERKAELDNVVSSLHTKKREKDTVEEEYELSKRMLDEEEDKLREIVGLYEIKESRIGKVAGFVGGVLASLLAAAIIVLIRFLLS